MMKGRYFLTFEQFTTEVIGAEERCSNNALASAGVCVNKPVMTGGELASTLSDAFDGYSFYERIKVGKGTEILIYQEDKSTSNETIGDRTFGDFYGEQRFKKIQQKAKPEVVDQIRDLWDRNILAFTPVAKKVIGYIKAYGPQGSYFIQVPRHVFVVHKMPDGGLAIVDTEEKFDSGKGVKAVYYVERDPKKALDDWAEQNPDKAERTLKRFLT